MNQIMQQLNDHNTMYLGHMRHIRRRNRVKLSGWLVRYQYMGAKQVRMFLDSDHDSKDGALIAAMKFLDESSYGNTPAERIFWKRKKLRKTNKSGVAGVYFDNRPGRPRWLATWQEDGRNRLKAFSVSRYGEDGAKQMAIQARESNIARILTTAAITTEPNRVAILRTATPITNHGA